MARCHQKVLIRGRQWGSQSGERCWTADLQVEEGPQAKEKLEKFKQKKKKWVLPTVSRKNYPQRPISEFRPPVGKRTNRYGFKPLCMWSSVTAETGSQLCEHFISNIPPQTRGRHWPPGPSGHPASDLPPTPSWPCDLEQMPGLSLKLGQQCVPGSTAVNVSGCASIALHLGLPRATQSLTLPSEMLTTEPHRADKPSAGWPPASRKGEASTAHGPGSNNEA